jgi:hypothetical protein
MRRKRNSTGKKNPPYLLWASVVIGLLFMSDGIYYLIPAEGVRSHEMIAVNWAILVLFVLVAAWSLFDAIRGVARRNFKAVIPLVLNLLWLVIYALAAAMEQTGA